MKCFSLTVEGIGFWYRGIPNWEAACAFSRDGHCVQTSQRPNAEIIAPNQRRRIPDNVAVALNVASAACASAKIDPASLPSIFTSSHGDQSIFDYICAALAQNPLLLSPTKFLHSVHNAAAGYWSIGAHARTATTALCAGPASFAQGILDAYAQLVDGARAVLLVGFDGQGTGPIGRVSPSRGLLGAALVLSEQPLDAARRLQIQLKRQVWTQSQATGPLALHCEGNASAAMLSLFDVIAGSQPQGCIPAGPTHCLQCFRRP